MKPLSCPFCQYPVINPICPECGRCISEVLDPELWRHANSSTKAILRRYVLLATISNCLFSCAFAYLPPIVSMTYNISISEKLLLPWVALTIVVYCAIILSTHRLAKLLPLFTRTFTPAFTGISLLVPVCIVIGPVSKPLHQSYNLSIWFMLLTLIAYSISLIMQASVYKEVWNKTRRARYAGGIRQNQMDFHLVVKVSMAIWIMFAVVSPIHEYIYKLHYAKMFLQAISALIATGVLITLPITHIFLQLGINEELSFTSDGPCPRDP